MVERLFGTAIIVRAEQAVLLPGGFVVGPLPDQDIFFWFKSHQVHARRDFILLQTSP